MELVHSSVSANVPAVRRKSNFGLVIDSLTGMLVANRPLAGCAARATVAASSRGKLSGLSAFAQQRQQQVILRVGVSQVLAEALTVLDVDQTSAGG